jgi:hypothetical protein
MTPLQQALTTYCNSPKQPADKRTLKVALLSHNRHLTLVRNYVCKNITSLDPDRYDTVRPYKESAETIADMIILLHVDSGMPATRGNSLFNIHSYTTDGDFFTNAARRLRADVDRSRPKRPPRIRNRRPSGTSPNAVAGNSLQNINRVRGLKNPNAIPARPEQGTPIDQDYILKKMPAFEQEVIHYLESARDGACNDANILIACALSTSMGACRYFSAEGWSRLVTNAKPFFIRQSRNANRPDEDVRMHKAIALLSDHNRPENFKERLLSILRLKAPGNRISRVELVVMDKIRELHSKYGLDPANP